MIGKVAGSGGGFRGVVNYLMLGKKDEPDPDRVAWVQVHNMLTENADLVPRIMRATANQSARCKKPVYHLAIAWHENENPTDDMMREVGAQTLKDLELEEHQALFIAHKDTAHKHLHIVINRVHPETTKAWSNSNDYKRIELSLRKQAEARGLPYVPGRFNDPEKFGGKGRGARNGEYQAAVRHGKPPPKGMWSKEDVAALRGLLGPVFTEARSWDDLETKVGALGFRVSPKGQGLIIEGADGYMKLSNLGKQVRLASLEDSFGERYAAYSPRRVALPDAALQPGGDILTRTAPSAPPSRTPGKADGPLDVVMDGHALRADAREAWRQRRLVLPRREKPVTSANDDDVPVGGVPHPEAADPKRLAYTRVREARAHLGKLQRDSLAGRGDPAALIEAQQQLDECRRELEELLNEEPPHAIKQDEPPPAANARSEAKPRPPAQTPTVPLPSPRAKPADLRADAFGALRAARQMLDMTEALFIAGIVDRKELDAATADLRRAAETLRPHLTPEEQLKNDIAEALRGHGKPRTPNKGGPSR